MIWQNAQIVRKQQSDKTFSQKIKTKTKKWQKYIFCQKLYYNFCTTGVFFQTLLQTREPRLTSLRALVSVLSLRADEFQPELFK